MEKGFRSLVTTLTKKMAEDLTEYMTEQGVKVRYMHSDIDTVERIEIIRDLRMGVFDVLIGINLLREGLDIPECAFVGILDADKEGFLRSETSMVQTIGRAARNSEAKVVLYADKVTGSMARAMEETERRRTKQLAHNEEHGITPVTVISGIKDVLDGFVPADQRGSGTQLGGGKTRRNKGVREDSVAIEGGAGHNLAAVIADLEKRMRDAAADLEFEEAARLRDELKKLREENLDLIG